MLKLLNVFLPKRWTSRLWVMMWGLLIALSAEGATLSVTPAAVSSTYTGVLTLQITGLTNGEQVILRRYLDINTNGVVDAGEWLIDAFRITDGGVNKIGGITNLNVPYDSNPATGAITTTLSFALPLERFAGSQVFQLVSPFGNFPPQSSIFNVTNAALNPSVSGTVFSGGSPVPNAVVVALTLPDNNFSAAVVADNAGHYVLKLNPGAYAVFPTFANYYTDQSIAALVALTNGGSASADLFLTNGAIASTISGQVTDATNGNTLGGVFLELESGNLFAIAFTDTNGNYSAALSPSFWKVRPNAERLSRRAYVGPQNRLQVDLTGGSVSNAGFALPKADALFYGRLTDISNVPFANIDFFGNDEQMFKANGFSDSNGNYVVAVFSGPDQWNSNPSSSDNAALAGYIISSGLGSVSISPGQALRQDFVALRSTGQIAGHLQDNLGNSVSDVNLFANATIGGVQYSSSANTDGSGNYFMPAAIGSWYLSVDCCGNSGLESHGLFDPVSTHFVSIPPTNAVLNLVAYVAGTPFLSDLARLSPSQFSFNLNGSIGAGYTVQASTNLSISNWFTLYSLSLTSNPMFLQDNQATNKQRFYRALKN